MSIKIPQEEWRNLNARLYCAELAITKLEHHLDRLDAVSIKLDYRLLDYEDFNYYWRRNELIDTHKLIHRSKDNRWETWVPVEITQKKDE